MRLSTSSLNEAAQCLKRYEYHHIDHLVPKPSRLPAAMRRGTWLHRAIEAYHQGKNPQEALKPMVEWALNHGIEQEQIQEMFKDVSRIFNGYVQYWKTQPDPWEFVLAERPLLIEGKTHTLQATVDLVVKDRLGTWIVEHKSTVDIPPASWRAVDPQTAIQYAACKLSDDPVLQGVDGIIFNYLKTSDPGVPRFKIKDGEPYANMAITTSKVWDEAVRTNEHVLEHMEDDGYQEKLAAWRNEYVQDGAFYQRYRVLRPDGNIQETFKDVESILAAIVEAQRTGHWHRSFHVLTCRRFCNYSDLCVVEYTSGQKSETLRDELFVQETPDIRWEGRIE